MPLLARHSGEGMDRSDRGGPGAQWVAARAAWLSPAEVGADWGWTAAGQLAGAVRSSRHPVFRPADAPDRHHEAVPLRIAALPLREPADRHHRVSRLRIAGAGHP